MELAEITQTHPSDLALSGSWTVHGLGSLVGRLSTLRIPPHSQVIADGSLIVALDTAGAWVLQEFLARLRSDAQSVTLKGFSARSMQILELVAAQVAAQINTPAPARARRGVGFLWIAQALSRSGHQSFVFLSFVGENCAGLVASLRDPQRLRLRPILFNIRTAGFDALPIVGLLSLLLGVVIAYQGADQLRQYGANIFVADLVGLSMLREFAPLITAIIVAGRSGSAYAAQIGTMCVTEEIDALRTLDIDPLGLLVLPKVLALIVVMPLLTVFADILGVFGGMLTAQGLLDVSFAEFLDRFEKAVSLSSYLVGIGKAAVFGAIIATVGSYQGFQTRGGADGVGRQTTRSVVQGIFLVIVVDAVFSIFFSILNL